MRWPHRRPIERLLHRLMQRMYCRYFARDLSKVLQKACFGRLPKGKYITDAVYARHLSREALCPYLEADTLARMDACTQVSRQEWACRMTGCEMSDDADRTAALDLAITLHFEGQLASGEAVSVHLQDKKFVAALVVESVGCSKLVRLVPVSSA